MTVPVTNVGLSAHIQGEFGGTNPTNLSEYARGGANVPASQGDAGFGIPTASPPYFMGRFRNQTKIVAGGATFTSSGSFTVPAGITALRVTTIGGGGGGGGATNNGDSHPGGAGGGAGFQYNQSLTVSPGQVITVVVGAGGVAGAATWIGCGGASVTGGIGGNSYLQIGASQFVISTGGFGGNGGNGDNPAPTDGNHPNRSGKPGTPGTVPQPNDPESFPTVSNGAYGEDPQSNRNNYFACIGTNNGTIYGRGGNGQASGMSLPAVCPTVGTAGFVAIRYGTAAPFTYNRTISANTNNFNIWQEAIVAGWDAQSALIATITINGGVTVVGDYGNPALSAGGAFPAGSSVTLINNGTIIGQGGDGGRGNQNPGANGVQGGTALYANGALTIQNNGTIAGGGGGGGGGGGAYSYAGKVGGVIYSAGGGGGGGRANSIGGQGGPTTQEYGNRGSLTAPGTGNAGGGNGGAAGSAGAPGASAAGAAAVPPAGKSLGSPALPATTGGAGGTSGYAILSNVNVTWTAFGTRLGPIA
jgi:hypothetical protein